MANTRTFSFLTNGNRFDLAVNPRDCTVSDGSGIKTVELLNIGEIGIAGNRKLMRISISNTFLPFPGSPFYRGVSPEQIEAVMRKAKDGKRPVRIIISGTDINREFLIDKLNNTYKEGQDDIYIDWSFAEYRKTTVIPVASLANRYTDTGINSRASDLEVPKAITVKKGTTLWALAKKYYDDGSRWREIAEANDITDERKLQIGKELKIP